MSDRFDMSILSRLRLKQLALVASLSETKNLHASARKLNLSQPGATKLLQEVERTLGVDLFIRGSKGMEPSIFGLAVARHARTILSEVDRLKKQIGAMARCEIGSVRMGAIMEAVPGVMTEVVNRLIQSGTGPLINLTVSTSDHLVAALKEGELDLALGRPVEHVDMGNIRFEPLWAEELSIVAASGHPLMEIERLTLEQLLDYEWILQSSPSPMRTSIELTFARAGLPVPNSRLETSSMLMTANLVSRSNLLAVLPRSVARFYMDMGLISEVGVDLEKFFGRYGLLVPNRDEPDPIVEALVRHIQSIASA
ncbi:LysR family transcriptional regulator [Pseudorhodobacter sp.]|uniref:LysR family transcriptional regulator n=1 Tax=Pseudorhodobacter sp. TaxID=1934400 RepID=UPI002649E6CE|nr:LysR family transcriptional regulator [Pseudorhodobacter sp.]MDN5787253.1 LysR family transcriptional regulator [Pseudorhodobacter sp.]